MKILALVAAMLLSACSGVETNASTPHNGGILTAKVPDVVSAPSLKFTGGVVEAKSGPQNAVPSGPRIVNFTDVKFRLTLPSKDWDVKITPQGVLLVNLDAKGMVLLVVGEDARSLKDIAEDERKGVAGNENAKATPVTMEKNPERARFTVKMALPDGTNATMAGVYQRNPGNPAQTVAFIGTWITGQKAVKKQVLGIIDSIQPLQ